jgi:hypothetical protein
VVFSKKDGDLIINPNKPLFEEVDIIVSFKVLMLIFHFPHITNEVFCHNKLMKCQFDMERECYCPFDRLRV